MMASRTKYHREYWRKYRILLGHQRAERQRNRRAGVRPGGGCVKCELWAGCGGLFCEQERRADR